MMYISYQIGCASQTLAHAAGVAGTVVESGFVEDKKIAKKLLRQ